MLVDPRAPCTHSSSLACFQKVRRNQKTQRMGTHGHMGTTCENPHTQWSCNVSTLPVVPQNHQLLSQTRKIVYNNKLVTLKKPCDSN